MVIRNRGEQGISPAVLPHRCEVISSCPTTRNPSPMRSAAAASSRRASKRIGAETQWATASEAAAVFNLVLHPVGPYLPAAQPVSKRTTEGAQGEVRHRLHESIYDYQTCPSTCFRLHLEKSSSTRATWQKLLAAFNPSAAQASCAAASSAWTRGFLYDCDLNQMLSMQT